MKLTLIVSILVFILAVQFTWSQIPQTMSYQGFLTDAGGTPVADGNYSLAFSIYSVETGGSALWTETHASVAVNEGIFNVILGSVAPLNIAFDAQYWLEVEVNSAVVSPRVQLTSSPYSLNAQTVADGAVTEGKIAADAVTSGKILDGAISLADLGQNGAVSSKIIKWGGGMWTIADDEKGTDGAGTVNRIPRFIGLASLGDSEIYETGGKIGVGLTSPGEKLTVAGTIHSTSGGVKFPDDTVQASAGWSLTGNAGATSANFLGTTDDQALELRVNNVRALRVEPASFAANLIGGYSGNWLKPGVYGATISGGGRIDYPNRVTTYYGTVGGGINNQAGTDDGAIDAGRYATVGGGHSNEASGRYATIGGGLTNTATAPHATVPGGLDNDALGDYSFAAGRRAKANHDGAFVWGDSTAADIASTANDQFIVRAGGGVDIHGVSYALRLESGAYGGSATANVIAGYSGNYVDEGIWGATIGGGGNSYVSGDEIGANRVIARYGTVGGGVGNEASYYATIGGGEYNAAGDTATVGGGAYNAVGNYATIGGGYGNAASYYATIGGGRYNAASARFATIAGGGPSGTEWPVTTSNRVTDDYGTIGGGGNNQAGDNAGSTEDAAYATVGGGRKNTASNEYATVGGGYNNNASGSRATIGGGMSNEASNDYTTVAGGYDNTASWFYSTVGGGNGNTAMGVAATVPGGAGNVAWGDYSLAAGRRARANHTGCFLWGDNTDADLISGGNNRFIVRASGGVYFYTSSDLSTWIYVAGGGNSWNYSSDQATKENFASVGARTILEKLAVMPVQEYNLKSQDSSIRHIGPVAQDFYAAFGLGEDERHISTADADGVALAAIQGLYELVKEKDAQIAAQQEKMATMEARLKALEELVLR